MFAVINNVEEVLKNFNIPVNVILDILNQMNQTARSLLMPNILSIFLLQPQAVQLQYDLILSPKFKFK